MPERPASRRKGSKPSASPWTFVIGLATGAVIVAAIFLLRPSPTAPTPQTAATGPATERAAGPMPVEVTPVSPAEIARVERISASETRRMLDAGEAIIIDVRDVHAFVDGHIPGALQIPLEYVPSQIPWFPRDRKIITYCA
jgi:hypothetical protein